VSIQGYFKKQKSLKCIYHLRLTEGGMFPNLRRTIVLFSSFVILAFCLSSFGSPVSAYSSALSFSSPARIVKSYSATAYESTNWAGYAINAATDSVSQVKGSWTEPAVTCSSGTTTGYAVFWVGIDGLTSGTVEQTGTAAECANGVASYFAWYEFYPSPIMEIASLTVSPGNVISASVRYSTSTSKFTISIKDVTTGKSFSHSAAVSGADRSSAEWIAEAPAYCSSPTCLYPLANFRTASFGKDTTRVTGTNAATVSGSTKPILKFGSMVEELVMVDLPPGTTTKAQPSALSTDGTSFSITWVGAGP
jgi:hypothetical protein